jgi:dihydrofolate synthase/folylpolyglutamate synthase
MKVGLFTSPHISTFRERIQVNGEYISKEAIIEFWDFFLKKKLQHPELENVSMFDFNTVLAFKYWQECGVEVASLETGLGGLYDSTNVVEPKNLDLTCITSIGLDHIGILGDTEAKILENKAGILKQKVPILIGNTVDFKTIHQKAMELKSDLYTMREFLGDYELENKRLVQMAGQILKQKYDFCDFVDEAFAQPMKGRFEKVPSEKLETLGYGFKTVIMDVGHNP